MFNPKTPVALLASALTLFTFGCGTSVTYTNQLNTFDGTTYTSLLAAHAALDVTRAKVQSSFPQYINTFNKSADSYAVAYNSYVLFRQNPAQNQVQISVEIAALATSIVALEDAFTAPLPATKAQIKKLHQYSVKLQTGSLLKPHSTTVTTKISIVDILTYLQLAATIAQGVPAASPYAALAQMVLQIATASVQAVQAHAGQAIDLTVITPIVKI